MNAKETLAEWSKDPDRTPLERQVTADVKDALNETSEFSVAQAEIVADAISNAAPSLTHRDIGMHQFVLTVATYINSCK
jgi:hypothetical protein